MPKLLVRHPEQGDLTFTLSGERITVGRHEDNQIQINHTTVSGHHAEFVRRSGRYVLHDLDSTNHSYIEGIMFIEAELDDACRIVIGTVECDFFPDHVEALPDEMSSLRKAVGLLRRQNDDLISKISEQKNQIDILGNVKLFTRDPSADHTNLRALVKSLTAERDRLASANMDLLAQIEDLHSKLGIVSISHASSPDATHLAKPPVRLGETVIVPSPHASGTAGR